MKKINKIIALVLSASMLTGLAGCKKNKKASSDGDVPTLTWLVPVKEPKDSALVEEKLNEISVAKIGAKIDIQWIDIGAYKEKMNTFMATSKKFDLAFAGFNNPLNNAATKGAVIALDELLEKTPALKSSMPEYAWNLCKVNGKIYGVPNYQILAKARCVNVNNDFLKEIDGFNPREWKKLDDVEPYLEEVKKYLAQKGTNNAYALAPLRESIMPLVFGYADEYVMHDNILFKQDDSGNWKGTIMWEAPEYKKGVERLYEWYQKGYIRSDILSAEGDPHEVYAVSFDVWKPGIETIFKARGIDTICQRIEKPTITDCAALTVISRTSDNPELAMKAIELVNTDKEYFNTLTLGIEGVHYEKTGENTFKYIGDATSSNYYLNSRAWVFGNQFNEYVQDGNDPDVWEQTKEYNDSAAISPFCGFSVDTKSIRTELSQLETVISAHSFVNVGAADPATYYDEFIKKIKAAGSDKIVEEYEKQIAEFLAANGK